LGLFPASQGPDGPETRHAPTVGLLKGASKGFVAGGDSFVTGAATGLKVMGWTSHSRLRRRYRRERSATVMGRSPMQGRPI
jgi:hypothetical protein